MPYACTAPGAPAGRDPERTRARILQAALAQFSAKGFAGARVDVIARQAGVNKRMLYHYFGHKEDLFRAVLRRKLTQRQGWTETTPDEPAKSLPFWFDLACEDVHWIRLLEWEALQGRDRSIIDEAQRREAAARSVGAICRRQARGHLSRQYDPRHLLLGLMGLTAYPVAFPQIARLITGRSVSDPQFRRERREFLRQVANAFSPSRK
jgi:TetR/AcrR family transcriptional regulator